MRGIVLEMIVHTRSARRARDHWARAREQARHVVTCVRRGSHIALRARAREHKALVPRRARRLPMCAGRCSHIASCVRIRIAKVRVEQSLIVRGMVVTQPVHQAATTDWQPSGAEHRAQRASAERACRHPRHVPLCEKMLAHRVVRQPTKCAGQCTTIFLCARHVVEANWICKVWARRRDHVLATALREAWLVVRANSERLRRHARQMQRARDSARISRHAFTHELRRPTYNDLSLCAAWC